MDKNIITSTKEKQLIVWALYDDAESSYKNAIKKFFHKKFKVYSVGINDVVFEDSNLYFYKKIDLSLNNFSLISQLKQLPKPDIILASPPCESWSGADCNGKMFRSIDVHGNWVVKNKSFYDDYNKTCHPVKRRYFYQKEQGRIIGESTIGATITIIEHFKPKVWVIENPQTSKTWEFQKYHWNFNNGYMNLAYYSSYNENFSKKPTYFKSNLKLDLKTNKTGKSNKDHMAKGSYKKRSSIPNELIQDLINQILNSKELNDDK